jgi:hypothetical protein
MANPYGRLWLLLALCLLPACGTSETLRTANTARLAHLQAGMSREEVLAVLGTQPAEALTEMPPYIPVVIENPYRRETFEVAGAALEVLYYLTTLHRADNAITPEELTPVVLQNGVLLGWGQAFWRDLRREYDMDGL